MPVHKGGRKGSRKHGKGVAKLAHSKWGTYAALIAHSEKKKHHRMEVRQARLDRLAQRRKAQCPKK
jgi:hypothetical protein